MSSRCGACGGFYNPACTQYPACQPALPVPLRVVKIRPHGKPEFKARLHTLGTDFEEFRDGAVPFPCAVIEHDDGRLESVHVNLVTLLEPTP